MSRLLTKAQLMCFFSFSYARLLLDYMTSSKHDRASLVGDSDVVNGHRMADGCDDAIVFYVATVGEFKGISSFIAQACTRWPQSQLVIIAGQARYIDSIAQAYPDAVILPSPSVIQARRLFNQLSPRQVFIAEGPCLLNCFPIRLDLNLVAAACWRDIPVVVINAALHEHSVSSRLDALEDRLFGSLHQRAICYWYTASEYFSTLLREGSIVTSQIKELGDVKFENVFTSELPPLSESFSKLLNNYQQDGAINIIGGSVNTIEEQRNLISSWLKLRETIPNARLVLAPRQIHQPRTMQPLYAFLKQESIAYSKRSDGIEASMDADLLILDVFGELSHFYSVATICYVGINHGLLEPLRYNKPIIVAPDDEWKSTYVTYPQYQEMAKQKAIKQLTSNGQLTAAMQQLLLSTQAKDELHRAAQDYCAQKQGASERILNHIEQHVLQGTD